MFEKCISHCDFHCNFKITKFRLLILVRKIHILVRKRFLRVFHQIPCFPPDPVFSIIHRVFHQTPPFPHHAFSRRWGLISQDPIPVPQDPGPAFSTYPKKFGLLSLLLDSSSRAKAISLLLLFSFLSWVRLYLIHILEIMAKVLTWSPVRVVCIVNW